jgi:hypothetical protein
MKVALFSLLCLPIVSVAADAPRGSFKSSQFSEARKAAQEQGKVLVFVETDSKTTCPKTEWGTKEVDKELRREHILVVSDDSDPENVQVKELFPAIAETVKKIGNTSPRVTVVEPESLKFITGTDYRNMSSDKRWSKKMEAAISKATAPAEEAEAATPAVPKKEEGKTAPVREWTNTEGKTIRAALVARKAGVATLKLENGKTVDYPIDKLSEESKANLPAE